MRCGLLDEADDLGSREDAWTKSLTVSDCSSTADREAALQLRNEVAGLRYVEGAGSDEEDVVGGDHAVLGVDGCAFDDGEDVALDAFAGDVGAVAAFASGDLVDLVEKDNAGVFNALDGEAGDLIHIDEAVLFFGDEILEGLGDLHLALLGALAEEAGEHILEVDVHLFGALVGDDLEAGLVAVADVEFYGAVVELALAELLAELFRGCGARGRRACRRGLRGAAFSSARDTGSSMRLLPGSGTMGIGVTPGVGTGAPGKGGSSRSSRRSSAASSALSSTSSIFSSRTMSMAISTRSRTMDSTSRPT